MECVGEMLLVDKKATKNIIQDAKKVNKKPLHFSGFTHILKNEFAIDF